ncbi:hypothetical protein A2239_03570 [Candidatus Uhrbacteria bacterium RIFOXYA2_FULL_40_9]|nr:MAG: hypothetical protein A2239_03570 [Candidatus Uhrbacteria bacterium RIFOXYA2_FULL_40_9]OGL97522.1 MAG: hypothetical protein A2332_00275 [Candidatus Uhrbacteria bacterium RIFOXYB2_FULL_41_18]
MCYHVLTMKEFFLTQTVDLSKSKIDYQKELNNEQFKVVTNGNGPCLVLAGAGSGKTRTITYRVAYLIESGVAPENILLVTFTNKAAKEMLNRVEGLLHAFPQGLWGGTFHSIANRLLRQHASEVGHTSNFTILDQEDAKSLIKICLKELKVDTTSRRFPSPANLQSMISYARNASLPLSKVLESRYQQFSDLIPTIERIGELYEARKRQADSMDFDDLLILLRHLLFQNPMIRERLANQFQYILVDEYQDTNVIQADIVHQLASIHGNILVVGDDAQSIYSFRAAEIKNILRFPNQHQETSVYHLTTNYRSAPEILAVANRSIQQNMHQFKKTLESFCPSCEKPLFVPAATASQEAQYIAEQVMRLRKEGISMCEIAVLFRAAFHSQNLEFELMRRDIPYEYRGGMKFFERAHVKDVVSFLRIIANSKDETAWMRVLGLFPGIGLVTAGKIVQQIQSAETIDEAIKKEVKVGSRAVFGWQQSCVTVKKALVGERLPGKMIREIISGSYRDYLTAEYPDSADRLDDLEQFAVFAEGYKDLHKFLDEVSLTENYGVEKEQTTTFSEEKMILSTIHQAKGLEWDAVFLMHLTDNKFPNPRALQEKGGLEEERRLFYVATTRARKQLFYTYPITSGYDSLSYNQPSLFLQEIPKSLLEEVKIKTISEPSHTSAWRRNDDPIIVLDDLGERISKSSPGSFLRGVDEL